MEKRRRRVLARFCGEGRLRPPEGLLLGGAEGVSRKPSLQEKVVPIDRSTRDVFKKFKIFDPNVDPENLGFVRSHF